MHVSSEACLSIFMLQLKSPASTIRFVFLCEYLNPKCKINEKTKKSHKLFLLEFLPFFLLVDCKQRLIREEQAIRQTAESGSGGGRASTHSSGQVSTFTILHYLYRERGGHRPVRAQIGARNVVKNSLAPLSSEQMTNNVTSYHQLWTQQWTRHSNNVRDS